MFGKKSAIRKYQKLLAPELLQRYGGAPYTPTQVEVTVKDLKLSKKYIKFAYLIFCNSKQLNKNVLDLHEKDKMLKIISTAVGGGIIGAAADSFAGGGDGGGGGE